MTHYACLTFDFDTWSGMVARGMKTPTPISRGEFGIVGAERILSLLAGRSIPSTWFVPGVVAASYPGHILGIAENGHEVGNHGWSHVPPASLTPEKEEEGLVRANEIIEHITGKKPRGYRSPSWDLSPITVDLLLQHGLIYDSSMMGHDQLPYFARQGDVIPDDEPPVFGKVTPLIEMPVSWSLDDYPHFEFVRTGNTILPGNMNAHSVEQNWIEDFEYMVQSVDWGVMTYTFHPYVVGRGHRMMLLERLVEGLTALGATFATLEDVAADFSARGN